MVGLIKLYFKLFLFLVLPMQVQADGIIPLQPVQPAFNPVPFLSKDNNVNIKEYINGVKATITTVITGACVMIYSEPAGAGVFLEGKALGITPLTLAITDQKVDFFKEPGKTYRLLLSKDFFDPLFFDFQYQRDTSVKLECKLKPIADQPLLYDGEFTKGYVLNIWRLYGLSQSEIKVMEQEIRAKYGKIFTEPKYRNFFFEKRNWYRENPLYTDGLLTAEDKKNLEVLKKVQADTREIKKKLIKNILYTHVSGLKQLIISDSERATVKVSQSLTNEENPLAYYLGYAQDSEKDLTLEGELFIWGDYVCVKQIPDDSGFDRKLIVYFTLDHKKKAILDMQTIQFYDGRYGFNPVMPIQEKFAGQYNL